VLCENVGCVRRDLVRLLFWHVGGEVRSTFTLTASVTIAAIDPLGMDILSQWSVCSFHRYIPVGISPVLELQSIICTCSHFIYTPSCIVYALFKKKTDTLTSVRHQPPGNHLYDLYYVLYCFTFRKGSALKIITIFTTAQLPLRV